MVVLAVIFAKQVEYKRNTGRKHTKKAYNQKHKDCTYQPDIRHKRMLRFLLEQLNQFREYKNQKRPQANKKTGCDNGSQNDRRGTAKTASAPNCRHGCPGGIKNNANQQKQDTAVDNKSDIMLERFEKLSDQGNGKYNAPKAANAQMTRGSQWILRSTMSAMRFS